jgi:hypothetical protein
LSFYAYIINKNTTIIFFKQQPAPARWCRDSHFVHTCTADRRRLEKLCVRMGIFHTQAYPTPHLEACVFSSANVFHPLLLDHYDRRALEWFASSFGTVAARDSLGDDDDLRNKLRVHYYSGGDAEFMRREIHARMHADGWCPAHTDRLEATFAAWKEAPDVRVRRHLYTSFCRFSRAATTVDVSCAPALPHLLRSWADTALGINKHVVRVDNTTRDHRVGDRHGEYVVDTVVKEARATWLGLVHVPESPANDGWMAGE